MSHDDAAGGADLLQIAREYDAAFYRVGIDRRALSEIEDVIRDLRLKQRALAAKVRVSEHAFAEFILAHPEVREITERRRLAATRPPSGEPVRPGEGD